MNKILSIALILIVTCSYSFAKDTEVTILENELSKLNLENPKMDLIIQIGRNNFRFIGLYGYTAYFPGIEKKDRSYLNKYGTFMIEGTSDSIESAKHEKFILKAKKYSEIYNSALLSFLKKYNWKPKEGYVPSKEVAIKIAIAVREPIYGKEKIEKEKPHNATLENGIWYVSGSIPEGWTGGVAEAEIIKENGKIIRISHGK